MGEIFRREIAAHPEPFTGERLTGEISGQTQMEHYHRYLFARSLVTGCDVLDIASGEGYGSALLAQVARSVVGVEYSGQTARLAAANFPRANLCFLQGDARAIPLAAGCVDAVVSFETIEHFNRQDEFLREVRRVLRPGGIFVVSTPDRDIYSPPTSLPNPFHVHELTRLEFVELLHAAFPNVALLQQRVLIGSAMLSETASSKAPLVFDRRGDTHFEACIGLPRAPYLIAVASSGPLPSMPPSLYISRGDVDTDAANARSLANKLRELQAKLADSEALLVQATQRAEQAEQVAAQTEQRAGQVAERAAQAEHAYAEVAGSLRTFWRGYWPRLLRQRP